MCKFVDNRLQKKTIASCEASLCKLCFNWSSSELEG